MTALPSQLSYAATPADSTPMVASDVRNPLASILTTVNSLITALGAGVAGQVLGLSPGATAPSYPPGYELDYVAITSSVNVTATTGATANTVITGTSETYDGTAVWIEFFSPRIDNGTTFIIPVLYDGSTQLGQMASIVPTTTHWPVCLRYRYTPSAGTHQFIIKAFVDAGTGTVEAGTGVSGAIMPAYIRVTKA